MLTPANKLRFERKELVLHYSSLAVWRSLPDYTWQYQAGFFASLPVLVWDDPSQQWYKLSRQGPPRVDWEEPEHFEELVRTAWESATALNFYEMTALCAGGLVKLIEYKLGAAEITHNMLRKSILPDFPEVYKLTRPQP